MVYIVIPVHNRKEFTRGCLNSLQQQDIEDFTIIVVDDGSTDGTSEMIREVFPDVILLQGDGDLWWVGSINKGIRYTLSVCQPEDYILVINDDLVVHPDYLSSLLSVAKRHPKSIVGSVETTSDQPQIIRSGGSRVNWKTAKNNVLNQGRCLDEFPEGFVVEISKLTGRGVLFPSQVFREVGLYDNDHFKQCGDAELPTRAGLKFGYSLLVSYDAVVVSCLGDKDSINEYQYYTISDAKEYFWGIKSHFNLKDHYWFARKIAPNWLWFIRFAILEFLRNVYHFVIRLWFKRSPR
jgi:GT2 family glycosyltransferase